MDKEKELIERVSYIMTTRGSRKTYETIGRIQRLLEVYYKNDKGDNKQ